VIVLKGIVLQGENYIVNNNLVSLSVAPATYQGRLEEYNFAYHGGIDGLEAVNISLSGNVVAGSERAGYRIHGEPCLEIYGDDLVERSGWGTNEARSCFGGIIVFYQECLETEGCSLFRNFKISRSYSFGIYISSLCNVQYQNLVLVENSMSILTLVSKPSIVDHEYDNKYMTLRDSVFVGQSPYFVCDEDFLDRDHPTLLTTGSAYPPFIIHVDGRGYGMSAIGETLFSEKYLLAPGKTFAEMKAWPAKQGKTTIYGKRASVIFSRLRLSVQNAWKKYVYNDLPIPQSYQYVILRY